MGSTSPLAQRRGAALQARWNIDRGIAVAPGSDAETVKLDFRDPVTVVDARDLGDVAALSLVEPERHRGAAYTLTGPEAVSFVEAARIFTTVLSRPIRHRPAGVLRYARHARRRGLPWGQVAVQTILHVGLRFDQASVVDPTLTTLLGRKGRTLTDNARDPPALRERAVRGDLPTIAAPTPTR